MNINFLIIQKALAHEEGATKLNSENTLGPVLALVIIIAAIIAAKYIKKSHSKTIQNNETN